MRKHTPVTKTAKKKWRKFVAQSGAYGKKRIRTFGHYRQGLRPKGRLVR